MTIFKEFGKPHDSPTVEVVEYDMVPYHEHVISSVLLERNRLLWHLGDLNLSENMGRKRGTIDDHLDDETLFDQRAEMYAKLVDDLREGSAHSVALAVADIALKTPTYMDGYVVDKAHSRAIVNANHACERSLQHGDMHPFILRRKSSEVGDIDSDGEQKTHTTISGFGMIIPNIEFVGKDASEITNSAGYTAVNLFTKAGTPSAEYVAGLGLLADAARSAYPELLTFATFAVPKRGEIDHETIQLTMEALSTDTEPAMHNVGTIAHLEGEDIRIHTSKKRLIIA